MNNTAIFESLGIGDKVKVVGNAGSYNIIQSAAPEQSDPMCYILVTNDGGKNVIKVTRDQSYRIQLLERFPERHNAPPMWNSINDGN